jgi:hypothetical protein
VVAACVLIGWSSTSTAGADSACPDLGGTVGPDQICQVHTETATYTVDFKFPVDYPDQQRLTDYVTHERDEFVGFVTTRPPRPDLPYSLDAQGKTYESGSPTSGTRSLVFTVYNESGGAHPVTHYDAFNYDLSKGVPITFDTMFKPGTNPLDVISSFVRGELAKRFGSEQMWGGQDVKTYKNFALTDDAVIFFFGQGLVLAEVDGPIEVRVPRSQLASLLA